jgi:hypothetical protein
MHYQLTASGRIVLCLLVLGGAASAQTGGELTIAKPNPRFHEYKTFRCTYTESEGRDYERTPPRNLHGESYPEVIFDNIDYTKRSARLIGNVGSSDVGLVDGQLALTFIEISDTGNVIINTIFKSNKSEFDQAFRIATSRHIARPLGGDTVGQFYGTCRALI